MRVIGFKAFTFILYYFIFILAVYGPLIGIIIVKLLIKDSNNSINVPKTMNKNSGTNGKWLFLFLPILLVYQCLTSGTEEFVAVAVWLAANYLVKKFGKERLS